MENQFSKKEYSRCKVKFFAKEEIEAHEIFLEAKKMKNTSPILETEEGRFELPINGVNFLLCFLVAILLFAGLGARIFYLQINDGKLLRAQALNNKSNILTVPAARGIIYDRNLEQLVFNVQNYDLIIIPSELPKEKTILEDVIALIAKTLDAPQEKILIKIQESLLEKKPFLLSTNLDHDSLVFFETNNIPGILLEVNYARSYKDSEYFSHVLGYTGKVDKKDLAENSNYFITDFIGKSGIEYQYERFLRGESGEKIIERDVNGKQINIRRILEPKAGKNIILTIDGRLQRKIYDVLRARNIKKAAVVAINPRNGEILALVSLPSFDGNIFINGRSGNELEKVLNDPFNPLVNRAVSGVYPPGSTIKPFLAVAALEEKIVTPKTVIFDTGAIYVKNQYNPEIIYIFPDWKAHGWVDIIKAIAQSCNVYFYTIGGGYGDIKGLGADKIVEYLELFGWGNVLNVDILGESSGLLPTAEWKQEKKGENWFIGDTYHIAIGQGDIGVTPLQIAAATAALANKGILYKPKIMGKIADSSDFLINDFNPEIIRRDFVSKDNIEIARAGMREAVISGSSQALSLLSVKAAGKTGTAQFGEQGKSHAWWTGFAPFDEPEIALTILVEGGGEGSSVAVPIAREILEWYLQ